MSTPFYRDSGDGPEDLGLKFCGSKRFEDVRLSSFAALATRLATRFGNIGASLVDVVAATVERTVSEWPRYRELLHQNPALGESIDKWMHVRAAALLGRE